MAKKQEENLTVDKLIEFMCNSKDACLNFQTEVFYKYKDDNDSDVAFFDGIKIIETQEMNGETKRKLIFELS